MPAPATSSRHLYTGHRRGHIQAAPRLRAHQSEPLSWDHPQIPVSMPSLFRFDASAVVHTCSSSHRTPAPLTARRQPQRSPPRLLTDAACGGSQSPPPRRPRSTYLHHWHSTDRADDLLHRHHFPSGHTWVPEILVAAGARGHPSGAEPVPAPRRRTRWDACARERPRQPISTRTSEPWAARSSTHPSKRRSRTRWPNAGSAPLRRELLDRTIIWNRRRLEKLVVDYIDHCNTHRPHRSPDQRPLVATDADQPDGHLQVAKTVRCGGLINEYRNAA